MELITVGPTHGHYETDHDNIQQNLMAVVNRSEVMLADITFLSALKTVHSNDQTNSKCIVLTSSSLHLSVKMVPYGHVLREAEQA